MTSASASPLRSDEVPAAVALLDRLNVSVAGVATRSLHYALCRSRAVLAIAGREQNEVAGIALIQLNRKWIYSHPLLLLRMLWSRVRRPARDSESSHAADAGGDLPQIEVKETCPISWNDPVPRTLFIGVHPQFWGRGLGGAMYREVFRELRRRGERAVLARIDPSNAASLMLHSSTGWKLFRDGEVITAVKWLDAPESMREQA